MSKRIIIVWGIIVIGLLATVCIIGLKDKDFNYIKLEFNLKKATRKYIKEKDLTPKVGNSITIFINELTKDKYVDEKSVDKYCIKEITMFNGILFDEYTINKNCKEINKE